MKSFVSGFQTKRRKFSIRSLQVFFSFKVAIFSQNSPKPRPPQKLRNSTGAQTVAQEKHFGFYTFFSAEGHWDYFLYQWKPLLTIINQQQIPFFIKGVDNAGAEAGKENFAPIKCPSPFSWCLSRSAELCILPSARRACDRLGAIAVIRADKAKENLFLSGFGVFFFPINLQTVAITLPLQPVAICWDIGDGSGSEGGTFALLPSWGNQVRRFSVLCRKCF